MDTCSTTSEIQKTPRVDGFPGQKNFRRGHARASRPLKNFRRVCVRTRPPFSGIRNHAGHVCSSFCRRRGDVDRASSVRRPSALVFHWHQVVFFTADVWVHVHHDVFCSAGTPMHADRLFCLEIVEVARPQNTPELAQVSKVRPTRPRRFREGGFLDPSRCAGGSVRFLFGWVAPAGLLPVG